MARFVVPRVRTWERRDGPGYRRQAQEASCITPDDAQGFERVVFSIRCVVGESRGRWQSQVPDVDNIPRPIVDAFTGLLCPDGAFHPSPGVQVEAE